MKLAVKIVAALAVCTAQQAFGQTQSKTAVKFDCSCDDVVGAKYATAFRDILATSPRYTEASKFVVGTGKDVVWNYGVHVVSLDPSSQKIGESTVLAVTITWGPLFLDMVVQTCGNDVAKSCAASTFAALDKDVKQVSN